MRSACVRRPPLRVRVAVVLGAALLGVSCKSSVLTAPTTTAPPSITENWSGTIAVGASKFYAFTVSQNGEVDVTLLSVTGTDVPPTIALGLGLGDPQGIACSGSVFVTAQAGTTAQLTQTFAPGVHCLVVADVGNLVGPATFAVTIAHP